MCVVCMCASMFFSFSLFDCSLRERKLFTEMTHIEVICFFLRLLLLTSCTIIRINISVGWTERYSVSSTSGEAVFPILCLIPCHSVTHLCPFKRWFGSLLRFFSSPALRFLSITMCVSYSLFSPLSLLSSKMMLLLCCDTQLMGKSWEVSQEKEFEWILMGLESVISLLFWTHQLHPLPVSLYVPDSRAAGNILHHRNLEWTSSFILL